MAPRAALGHDWACMGKIELYQECNTLLALHIHAMVASSEQPEDLENDFLPRFLLLAFRLLMTMSW